MFRNWKVAGIIASVIILGYSCEKDRSSGPEGETVAFVRPSNFPEPVYQFEGNKLTAEGFELGRKLFYDQALSLDNSTSCGSCHQQFAAFANLDHSVSHGIDNCLGTRNAPPLFNMVWQSEFMWDGGVHHIEFSSLNALTNPCEMGMDLDSLTARLSRTSPYPHLFQKAFGSAGITSQRVLKALTQFMGAMVSANSKYDKYVRREPGGEFTQAEQAGYQLFKAKCASCHTEPLFSDFSYRSNGLDLNPLDRGRDSITNSSADRGTFRVPSLRNIEVSRPYMHDGRFFFLEDVLEHYNSGVKAHRNLDPSLRNGERRGIPLSKTDQSNIIAFLKTLTDHEFLRAKKFSEP
ncbi:cytochrome-c peroxidase [Pedobacter sp. SYSU D00535]|uniref:cytochrome-c peroxidase n=1 Tax=Pedobacter sp. SYSU D00535 TaxID=2810308 RepID=UPI001A9791BF|nr:cytochrome c peroxidase [Pedobacter sp. SYSU D00535]